MLKFDEKELHRPPKHPHKPPFSLPERVHYNEEKIRELIDMIFRYEKHLEEVLQNITSDNVVFKETVNEEFNKFIEAVQTEINLFESNAENESKLFETAFEQKFLEKLDEFKTAVEDRLEKHNETHTEAYNEFVNTLRNSMNVFTTDLNTSFKAFKQSLLTDIDNRLDGMEAVLNDAKLYMKTNLVATVDNIIAEMVANGEIADALGESYNQLGKKISRVVVPEMYGAIGDGVADDTIALKECIKSGNFILLKGTYKITSCLSFDNISNLIMYGGKITRDKDLTFNTIKGGTCSNILISNAEFDGNGNNTSLEYTWSDNTQVCIFLAGDSKNIFVEKCTIKNHNYGIFTLGANFTEELSVNATIRDCYFENCTSCIDTYGKNILIDHNSFKDISGNAIQIEPEGEPVWDHPLDDGSFYQSGVCCSITNNMLINVDGWAIIIHDNAYGVKIDGNTIIDFKNAINANRSFVGCFVTNNTIIQQKEMVVNTNERPWKPEYSAIYCGENSHVEGNILKLCYTAINGTVGSIIKGNEIISPYVCGIAVSSGDTKKLHYIVDNIVKDFTKNGNAWWGAHPIVLNGGSSVILNNIVYSDCEPVCSIDAKATIRNLISTVPQSTPISAVGVHIYETENSNVFGVGYNLRGKTIILQFADISNCSETRHLVIDANNYVKSSIIGDDGYSYWDDIKFGGESYSEDNYAISPITHTFPNDKDYIVTEYNPTYLTVTIQ